jgi:DNA polymerase-4
VPKIVHADVDAFFASVEQLLNPALRGKPVLVGRGVVASASYEAKALGVKTAMTIRRARELCPQAILVAGRYEHYADYAQRIKAILLDFTPAVEQAALDDFYLDFTGTDRLYPDFPGKLRALQQRIQEDLGLSVSVGAATSKMVASIASRLRRPRGFRIISPGTEEEFLAPLPVEKLLGIGHSHEQVLQERGIRTIGELRRVPRELLIAAFGNVIGSQLYDRARGMDSRAVTAPATPKSISRETTIEGGTIDLDFLRTLIEYLAERVASTLRGIGRQARTLALHIRYTDFGDAARSTALDPPTNDEKSLLETAIKIFHALYTRRVAIRFVGVGVANLEPESLQNEFFDRKSNRRWYLNRGVDKVRKKFGWNALFYGNGLALREHYAAEPFGLVLSTPCLSR